MVDMPLMEMVSLWLAANGITPKSVSLREVPVVTGSTIVLFIREVPYRLDPATDAPAGRVVATPLLVRPTAMVQDWLDGKRQMEAR